MSVENKSSLFLPYQSASYSQKYLRRIYEVNHMEEPINKSYKNGYAFTYYLIHGERFFNQASMSPNEIKPLLLFYGMVQLCKACLLTIDQDYPNNSTVLAHGVSTRKIKKQSFEFLHDTVLVQKKGLFSHMATTLFSIESLEGMKFKMEELMAYIPELNPIYSQLKGKRLCHPVYSNSESVYYTERQILDDLNMTEERFFRFFNAYFSPLNKGDMPQSQLNFKFKEEGLLSQVFLKDDLKRPYLSSFRVPYPLLPELLVHYLLLYNLSMITRYETEWWNDLFLQRSSTDISFILAMIEISEKKIPIMVQQFLEQIDPIYSK